MSTGDFAAFRSWMNGLGARTEADMADLEAVARLDMWELCKLVRSSPTGLQAEVHGYGTGVRVWYPPPDGTILSQRRRRAYETTEWPVIGAHALECINRGKDRMAMYRRYRRVMRAVERMADAAMAKLE